MFVQAVDRKKWTVQNCFHYLSQVFVIASAFVLPLSTAALEFFLTASVLCTLLQGGWREKYHLLCHNLVALMFLIFFSLFLLGLSYTSASLHDAFGMLSKYSKFLLGFFLFSIFSHEKTVRYAVYSFLLIGTLTLLLSFIKFFSGLDILNRFGTDSGVFKDHIFTGFLLAFMSYCYALIAYFIKKWRRLATLLFFLAVFNVLFINIGRSGYVVLMSLVLLLAWQFWRWRGLLTAGLLAVVLLASLLFFSTNFKERMFTARHEVQLYDAGERYTSTGLRLSFYKNSLELLRQHPWIGTGTGSFARTYSNVVSDKTDPSIATRNPHNEYLHVGVQFGLIGLIVLLVLFYSHWRESFRLTPIRRYFSQAILVSIAVGCLFNSWLMDVAQGYFYVLFTALAFAGVAKLPGSEKVNNQII